MATISAPPILETARLRLRRPAPTDAEAVFAYGSDPEVARYADWPVRTSMDGLADSLRARAEACDEGSDFYWIITLAGEDRAIGGVACSIERDAAEIGFLLQRDCWSRGYTTEAAGAVLGWLRTLPTLAKVWATCDAENVASARVLEKLGLTREATLPRWRVRPNISIEPRDAYLYSLRLIPERDG